MPYDFRPGASSPYLCRLRMSSVAALCLLAIGLAGCSAESFYRSNQQASQQECRRLPEPQQAHCLSLYDTTYDEYRREREAARREDDSD